MQCDIRHLCARSRHILLASSLALGFPSLAFGQLEVDTGEVEEEEQVRRYTVEMIVFEYTSSASAGPEQFLPEVPPAEQEYGSLPPLIFGDPGTFVEPDLQVAIDEATEEQAPEMPSSEDRELEEIPSHIIQTQLEVLDPAEHAMKEIYQKLVRLDAYRPIMRAAWTQTTHDKEQTLPIKLRRLGKAPLRLDGTVMLYLSRYLHFVVDLTIEARENQSVSRDDDRVRNYGDRRSSTRYGSGYEAQAVPIRYTISEDRIFRNGELRYYDHPKFGVLARVTRIEEEELETDEMFLLPGEPGGAR